MNNTIKFFVDKNNNYTLLQLNPQTGRKHQIRKQLLIHGHPVVGDSKYRITESYSDKPQTLMLHAYKINFSIMNKMLEILLEMGINGNQIDNRYQELELLF